MGLGLLDFNDLVFTLGFVLVVLWERFVCFDFGLVGLWRFWFGFALGGCCLFGLVVGVILCCL